MKAACVRTIVLLVSLSCAGLAQDQQFARIGDFRLESGESIRDCIIGYRALGAVNSRKDNVVVFPTYLGGRSGDLMDRVGPGKMIDTTKYYAILVDSLGDGVSSSPSNSKTQPRMQFPAITVRDMVNATHKMLTEHLKLPHVHAVVGFSMGGLQAFQWAVSFPDYMDKIVSISGSPQLSTWDMLWLNTELLAVRSDPEWKNGQYTAPPKLPLLDSIFALIGSSPEFVNRTVPRAEFAKYCSDQHEKGDFDANDLVRQMEAVLTQDVAAGFGGSLERAAAAVRVPALIIVNRQDHVVNPASSIRFGQLTKAQMLQLDSDCGHGAFGCEKSRIDAAVRAFVSGQ